jgi:hypothetical protein
MRKKLVAWKEFHGILDITDPCYRKDTWCRIKTPVAVKAGEYACRVWLRSRKEEYDGRTWTDTRVGIIGIYLNDLVPLQDAMKEIGTIGVDAGMAGFFMDKPDYNDAEWEALCDSTRKGDAWTRPEGFFSYSGYGDGVYPVYAAYDTQGEIIALEIRFM